MNNKGSHMIEKQKIIKYSTYGQFWSILSPMKALRSSMRQDNPKTPNLLLKLLTFAIFVINISLLGSFPVSTFNKLSLTPNCNKLSHICCFSEYFE